MLKQLKHTQLKNHLTVKKFELSKKADRPIFKGIIGQPRASKALEFGVEIDHRGYNLYVAGETGIGRTSYVLQYLNKIASQKNPPNDWVYINNFDDPLAPRTLSLAGKQGRRLVKDIRELIEEVLAIFPAIFEHPSFLQKKTTIEKKLEANYDKALCNIEKIAKTKLIAINRNEETIEFLPIIDGIIADHQALSAQSDDYQDNFDANVDYLQELLNQSMLAIPQWQRELNTNLNALHHQTIIQALKPLVEEIQKKYQGHTGVLLYIAQISVHLPKTIREHLTESNSSEESDELSNKRKLLNALYLPNLFVCADQSSGLPIVFESNPTFSNLFGHLRPTAENSFPTPEFQQLVAGSMHRANGGYILFDVEKVLHDEHTWETLKRIIREGRIKIEASPQDSNYALLSGLQPEYIPWQTKVILLGSRETYYHLSEFDPDFEELFRVLVDFGNDFDATTEYLKQFAYVIHDRALEAKLNPINSEAIKQLAEFACRLAEHQNKLSTHIKQIMDVAIEANYWCDKYKEKIIKPKHIQKALDERELRHARLCEQTLEEILSGAMTIASKGSVVGQVNGLSIMQVAESRFGSPMRITATVHPGTSGVVDIEREVELGQAVHSKGILLLSSFLRGRYAKDFPLAISAHIAIEQSYGYIDGDSASVGEMCALLSALVNIPLRQDIAITGSISQFGEVQSIGGVNEKIEGFFHLCESRTLTGSQGVIIPSSNQENLMLNEKVINAVAQKKFFIYAVETLDEAMHLLSGEKMGSLNATGHFPKSSINQKIVDKLQRYAELNIKKGQDASI
jgi:lon-related putative ATP-dependent protease